MQSLDREAIMVLSQIILVVISATVVIAGFLVAIVIWSKKTDQVDSGEAIAKDKDEKEEREEEEKRKEGIKLKKIKNINKLTRSDLKSIPPVWKRHLEYLSPTFATDIKFFLHELLFEVREAKLNINIVKYWSDWPDEEVDAIIQKCEKLGFIRTELITFPAEVDSYGLIIKPELKSYIIEVTQKGINYLED
jgi:hypothetical protein